MKSDAGKTPNAQQAGGPSDPILENVAAARRAVETAEAELDRVLGAIEHAARVEKQLVSTAVAAALARLRMALANLEAAQKILASSHDKARPT
jgi:hypothetical protein